MSWWHFWGVFVVSAIIVVSTACRWPFIQYYSLSRGSFSNKGDLASYRLLALISLQLVSSKYTQHLESASNWSKRSCTLLSTFLCECRKFTRSMLLTIDFSRGDVLNTTVWAPTSGLLIECWNFICRTVISTLQNRWISSFKTVYSTCLTLVSAL